MYTPSVQVENAHYGGAYDHKARWLNYWYQIREVLSAKPKNVLEVGLGSGLVAGYLRKQGIEGTTLDIDASLKPDVVGSITKIPLPDATFDVVLAAEVIEHIPFKALPEIVWVIDPPCAMLRPSKGGSEPCAISSCTERSWASPLPGRCAAWTWT